MEKDYYYDVEIKWSGTMPAESKKDAIEKIKESYKQEYNIDLTDKEIKNVEETK